MGTERKWLHKVFSYEYANNKIRHIYRVSHYRFMSNVYQLYSRRELLVLCYDCCDCVIEQLRNSTACERGVRKRWLHSRLPCILRYIGGSCWRSAGVCETATQCSRSIMLWLWKKQEQSLEIYHEGCQGCVRSFCDEGARYSVQWLDSVDLYIVLNLLFVYCAQSVHVIFIP